jgi:hypothetical protein
MGRIRRLACSNEFRPRWGRVTTGLGRRSVAGGGGEVEEPRRFGQVEGGEDRLVPSGERRALGDRAVADGEGDQVQPVELLAQAAPGMAGAVLDDPDEQQGQPAQLNVGADAVSR